MRTLTRDAIHYYFDPDIPPVLTLEPGEVQIGQLLPSRSHTAVAYVRREDLG